MLGTSGRPVVAPNGRIDLCENGRAVSWRDMYAPVPARENPAGRWRRLCRRIRHAVGPWLRRTSQDPVSAEHLTAHLLRDVGMEPIRDPNTHSIPFRLPRQL